MLYMSQMSLYQPCCSLRPPGADQGLEHRERVKSYCLTTVEEQLPPGRESSK